MGDVFVCNVRARAPEGATVYATLQEAVADPAAARIYVLAGERERVPCDVHITRAVDIVGCRRGRDERPYERISDPDQDEVPRLAGRVRVAGAAVRLSGLDIPGVAAAGAQLTVKDCKLGGLAAEGSAVRLSNILVEVACVIGLRDCQCDIADLELEHDNVEIIVDGGTMRVKRISSSSKNARLRLDRATFSDTDSDYLTLRVDAADSALEWVSTKMTAWVFICLTRSSARLGSDYPGQMKLRESSNVVFVSELDRRVDADGTSAFRFE